MSVLEERITHGDEPLQRQAHGQQDGAVQADIGCGEQQGDGVGEEVGGCHLGQEDRQGKDGQGGEQIDQVKDGQTHHQAK